MKKILITGGAGFIGSHLTEYLLKQGHQAVVVDNFFTGSRDNLAHLINNSNLEIIEHNIIENNIEEKINFSKVKIDEIYNLACPASPVAYQKTPVETVKANVIGMINMLELAKKLGAKILQASTSEIYGDPVEHPQRENYWGNVNCTGPRACYDEGKRCAETLCFDYYREYQVQVKVVRIFNTYGPRMTPDDGRVVSNFIVQALNNKDLTIYGDGKQTRSFQYVDDLVLGMVKMMESNGLTGPINLGNPDEFTIKELAEKIVQMVGKNNKIVYKDLPIDDPTRRRPDISLAKKELAWEPKIKLEEGLKKTVENFKTVKY